MMKYCLSFLLLFGVVKGSENKKLAQTGFQFLSVTSDARSGGMADAMTTIHGNSVSLFFLGISIVWKQKPPILKENL